MSRPQYTTAASVSFEGRSGHNDGTRKRARVVVTASVVEAPDYGEDMFDVPGIQDAVLRAASEAVGNWVIDTFLDDQDNLTADYNTSYHVEYNGGHTGLPTLDESP